MIVWSYDCLILLYNILLHETLWSSDLMIFRPYDRLILWSSNLMIVRPYDRPTLWSSDLMNVWPYDCPTLWMSDLMIVRHSCMLFCYMKPYDRPTLWSSDLMIVRTYDCPVKMKNLWSDLMIVRWKCRTYDLTLWSSCWWSSCWWLSANLTKEPVLLMIVC